MNTATHNVTMDEARETILHALELMQTIWLELDSRWEKVTEKEAGLDSIIAQASRATHGHAAAQAKELELDSRYMELEERAAELAEREAKFYALVEKNQTEFAKTGADVAATGCSEPSVEESADSASQTSNVDKVVLLNVGGTKFTTTKMTLMAEQNSFFHGMVSSGVWKPDPVTQEYFIDRDPQFFKEILNYLRNGKLDGDLFGLLEPDSPLSPQDRQLLFNQIDFLQLDSLIAVKDKPSTPLSPNSKGFPGQRPIFLAFAKWDFDATKQSDSEQDQLMNLAATAAGGTRAATMVEFIEGQIQGLPPPAKQPKGNFRSIVLFTGRQNSIGHHYEPTCKSRHARLGTKLPLPAALKFPLPTNFFTQYKGAGLGCTYYCVVLK
eukprot:TRINITY_DN76093_c0_g1_i1.p1 TRINITY_DN76093_c0_g1~~TRINITY_DN76093_c0_g1_i1.p1  ORF type:complete len:408 (+),score=37.94 TRINITY_DN76093_c0_g1_i1:81-1226(+)